MTAAETGLPSAAFYLWFVGPRSRRRRPAGPRAGRGRRSPVRPGRGRRLRRALRRRDVRVQLRRRRGPDPDARPLRLPVRPAKPCSPPTRIGVWPPPGSVPSCCGVRRALRGGRAPFGAGGPEASAVTVSEFVARLNAALGRVSRHLGERRAQPMEGLALGPRLFFLEGCERHASGQDVGVGPSACPLHARGRNGDPCPRRAGCVGPKGGAFVSRPGATALRRGGAPARLRAAQGAARGRRAL